MFEKLKAVLACALVASAFCSSAVADEDNWVSLFDGKTLEGWKVRGGFAAYKVEDGTIETIDRG